MRNLFVCGPCGVGKSTVSAWLASKLSYQHIEWDIVAPKLGITVNGTDLHRLMPHLGKIEQGFILDFGGDAIFRPNQDNAVNRAQLLNLKGQLCMNGLLLNAPKSVVLERLHTSPKGPILDFDAYWDSWINFGLPNWVSCVEHVVSNSEQFTDSLVAQLVDSA